MGERVAYIDSDSAFYTVNSKYPPLKYGDNLGDFKNELPGDQIVDFVY